MLKISAYGRANWDGELLTLTCAHDTAGYAEPVVLPCEVPERLRESAALLSDTDVLVWVTGDGWQVRPDEDRLELWVDVEALAPAVPSLTLGRSPVQAVAHGRIHGALHYATAANGWKAGREVLRGRVDVHSPRMDPGVPVVLRVKAWDEDARFIHLQHAAGDRINIEGALLEVRWNDQAGAARTAHQLAVQRWTYAKDREDRATAR